MALETLSIAQVQRELFISNEVKDNGFSVWEIISTIGIVSIVIAFIYIGKKLQILEDVKTCMYRMKINLNVISNYLIRNHTKFNPTELQTLSPFHLTNEGEEFIKKIGFDRVFENNKNTFFDFITAENVKLKYDVENASIKSIFALYDMPCMEFLKVFLYNNPNRNLENTAPTLGVYVRDRYLESHPEIKE